MADVSRDLAELLAMVDELDRFLDKGRPYRSVAVIVPTGGQVTATMSIGVILGLAEGLRADRNVLADAEQVGLDKAECRIAQLRSARATEYGSALGRELKSQVDTWRWYLDDCARGERDRVADYRFESGVRSRIAVLVREARSCGVDVEQSLGATVTLDASLKRVLQEGPYQGPEGQADRYPKSAYWWLYGHPVADE